MGGPALGVGVSSLHYTPSGVLPCISRFRNWFHSTSDGNFHATDKNKPIDPTDFALTLGAAYFADERDYKVFLTHARPQKEVSRVVYAVPDPILTHSRTRHAPSSARWAIHVMEGAYAEP